MDCFPCRFAFLLSLISGLALGHPLPDIPVRSHFQKDGTCEIKVEVDPRCFTAEPEDERYTMKIDLSATFTEQEKQELKRKAAAVVKDWVQFQFEPASGLEPLFDFEFTGINEAALLKADDPVVLTGTWKTKIPPGITGWRIHATEKTPFSIVFRNYLDGVELPRFSVLFPGETSFRLELTAVTR